MTPRPIFYFANAEGSGHTKRTEAVLQNLKIPAIVATEDPSLLRNVPALHRVHALPPWRSPDDAKLADDVLHVPYGRKGSYLERVYTTCQLCREYDCAIAVIDVCVEMAMTMRLCGIPYVYMRMSGRRNDAAHLQCYQAASGLLASYPEALEERWVPQWMRAKTQYVGGIFTQRAKPSSAAAVMQPIDEKPYVLVMRGKGDSTLTPLEIRQAASLVTNYYWVGIGFADAEQGQNYQILPYVDDPITYIKQAEVVVANAGNNSVLEVGRWGKPLITLPEVRFFDEQFAKARQLADRKLAVILKRWPSSTFRWQDALRRAKRLQVDTWSTILSEDGPQQAAHYIERQLAEVNEAAPPVAASPQLLTR